MIKHTWFKTTLAKATTLQGLYGSLEDDEAKNQVYNHYLLRDNLTLDELAHLAMCHLCEVEAHTLVHRKAVRAVRKKELP